MISMACLNLASKVQEVPSRLSDIVNTCYRYSHMTFYINHVTIDDLLGVYIQRSPH